MKEKTEQPTPKRLRDERKKGNVSKSKEIATCAVIVGLFGYMWLFFDRFMIHLQQIFTLPTTYYEVDFQDSYLQCIKGVVYEFVLISVPFALTAMVIIVLAYMLQFGVIFAAEPITPDFKRINPVEGFKRIFSLNNLLDMIKSIIKVVLLGTIVYLLLKNNLNALIQIPAYGIHAVPAVLGAVIKKLILYTSFIFIIIAILDYFFQKKLYRRKLKMSLDDIKREHKEREGDPQIKKQRVMIHRGIADSDMMTKIQNSTVIVTYSRKIAIALCYQYGKTKLPIVELKGSELMAEKIIDMARKASIPVVDDPSLAQKLADKSREDNYIPSEVIGPVALLLRSILGTFKA